MGEWAGGLVGRGRVFDREARFHDTPGFEFGDCAYLLFVPLLMENPVAQPFLLTFFLLGT